MGFFLLFLLISAQADLDPTCPKTPAEFRVWRDQSVLEGSYRNIGKFLGDCLESNAKFKRNQPLNACLKNIRYYLNGYLPGGSEKQLIETGLTDERYQELTGLPLELKDDRFLTLLQSESTMAQAIEWLETEVNSKLPPEKKMKAFYYKSMTLGFVEAEMIVQVPLEGGAFKILQFELMKDQKETTENSLIMGSIGVQKNENGKSIIVPGVHAKVEQYAPRNGGERDCMHCHKTGLMPIIPLEIDPKYEASLKEFNSLIQKNSDFTFLLTPEPASKGPPMGPIDEKAQKRRDEAFFKRCAPDLSKDAWNRIKESMNCATCHSGLPGELPPMSPDEIVFSRFSVKTAKMITEGKSLGFSSPSHMVAILTGEMPKGISSSDQLKDLSERTALMNCLNQEYYGDRKNFGLFQEWLTEGDCGVEEDELDEALALYLKNVLPKRQNDLMGVGPNEGEIPRDKDLNSNVFKSGVVDQEKKTVESDSK